MQNAADLFLPEAEADTELEYAVPALAVELFEWAVAALIAVAIFVGIMLFSVAGG